MSILELDNQDFLVLSIPIDVVFSKILDGYWLQ